MVEHAPTTYIYKWLRCDAAGNACVDIPLADTAGYTISSSDIGSRLRVRVTASNAYGSGTTQSAASPPVLVAVSDLILRYRPHILFDSQEPWRPIAVPTFLDERGTDGSYMHHVCPAPLGSCIDGSPAAAMTANNSDSYFLDISDNRESPDPNCHELVGTFTTSDCGSGSTSAVYVLVTEDATGLEFLDYWWFTRYNDVAGWIGSGVDDHEGDWEGVTIAVDALTSSTDPNVAWVDFSQHGVDEWEMGAIPGSTGTHIHVFSARGTHASYDSECFANINNCPVPDSPGGAYWESSYDGEAPWGNNSDAACGSACVVRFWSTDPQWTIGSGSGERSRMSNRRGIRDGSNVLLAPIRPATGTSVGVLRQRARAASSNSARRGHLGASRQHRAMRPFGRRRSLSGGRTWLARFMCRHPVAAAVTHPDSPKWEADLFAPAMSSTSQACQARRRSSRCTSSSARGCMRWKYADSLRRSCVRGCASCRRQAAQSSRDFRAVNG